MAFYETCNTESITVCYLVYLLPNRDAIDVETFIDVEIFLFTIFKNGNFGLRCLTNLVLPAVYGKSG